MKFPSIKARIFKKSNKSQIGFLSHSVALDQLDKAAPYYKTDPTTRFRCYDVINYLNSQANTQKIYGELYRDSVNYKIVFFAKCFQDYHISLAKKLKSKGTKILFDPDVNYLDLVGEALSYVKPWQKRNVLKMLELSDEVVAASEKIREIYNNYHENVTLIEENIERRFFKKSKSYHNNNSVFLLYCGYAMKAKEILLIKEILTKLNEQFSVKMLFICEKDPEIKFMPYKFVKFNYKELPNLLLEGDIKIAPRDLSNSYNWGHSFSKVAYPMSVGIPAVASPVPSYLNRGVTICNTSAEWYDRLKELILSSELRQEKGLAGRKVVKENFTIDVIGPQYIDLFKKYL